MLLRMAEMKNYPVWGPVAPLNASNYIKLQEQLYLKQMDY